MLESVTCFHDSQPTPEQTHTHTQTHTNPDTQTDRCIETIDRGRDRHRAREHRHKLRPFPKGASMAAPKGTRSEPLGEALVDSSEQTKGVPHCSETTICPFRYPDQQTKQQRHRNVTN